MTRHDLRLVAASLLLLWLASPYWPTTVDDVYISVGFAQQWADTGALTWVDGARVEGYSNFLWVALLAGCTALGTDPGLMAQLLALCAAGGVLAVLHARLPRGAAGTTALLATAGLASLSYWSVVGMETTLYALLLALGWSRAADAVDEGDGRAWSWAVGWLALASLTRLEGVGHLAAALALRPLLARRPLRADAAALAILAILTAYHAVRIHWYGAIVPTSVLVKVAGQAWGWAGLQQGALDVALGAGAITLCAAAAGPSRRRLLLAAAPLVLQAVVLARANGDWMAHGRLVLPGVLAMAAAVAGARGRPWGAGVWGAGLASAMVGMAGLQPGPTVLEKRAIWSLGHPHMGLAHSLETPYWEDLAWAVGTLPNGSTLYTGDAGFLSFIPGVALVDTVGLVDRELAEANLKSGVAAWLQSNVSIAGPNQIFRAARLGPQPLALPELMTARFPGVTVTIAESTHTHWLGTDTLTKPTPKTVDERWAALIARAPNQPRLWWLRARAAASRGAFDLAEEQWAAARHRFAPTYLHGGPGGLLLDPIEFNTSTRRDGRLQVFANGSVRTVEMVPAVLATLTLELEGQGGSARARVAWEQCESADLLVDVTTLVRIPLGGRCKGADPVTVKVTFENDGGAGAHNRDLWVAIRWPDPISAEL